VSVLFAVLYTSPIQHNKILAAFYTVGQKAASVVITLYTLNQLS